MTTTPPTDHRVELSAGTVEYHDTGGSGPALVLVHGLLMDASLWDAVVAELGSDHRCVVPTLPLGAHRHAARADSDLSPHGLARLLEELLEGLDLHDVTLVGSDTGGALVQLVLAAGNERVARAVLVSCDAFDNFPPGLTGRTLVRTGHLPPSLFGLAMQPLRLRPARRLPLSFGWLTRRGDAVVAGWLRPVLTRPDIRRDAVRVLRGIAAEPQLLIETAERLTNCELPVRVVWAREDRVMPPAHGRRLAELLPHGRLAEIDDSLTLVPLDQPGPLARAVRDFVACRGLRQALGSSVRT